MLALIDRAGSSAVTVLLGMISLVPCAVFLLSMTKSFDSDYYISFRKPDLSRQEIVPA